MQLQIVYHLNNTKHIVRVGCYTFGCQGVVIERDVITTVYRFHPVHSLSLITVTTLVFADEFRHRELCHSVSQTAGSSPRF